MNEDILRDHYASRGLDDAKAEAAVSAVRALESWLARSGLCSLESADERLIAGYVRTLDGTRPDHADTLLALARYFYLIGSQDIYIYFCLLFGADGVIGSILDSVEASAGPELRRRIDADHPTPPLGTPPEDMPSFTAGFVSRLEACLPESRCREVLSGNNHGIPAESFAGERELYLKSTSLDTYLRELHARRVAELQRHCDSRKIWFEQIITQDVVDYVKADQEILSAVRDGDRLYATKIPFDTVRLLKETDPDKRRYHLCHCPFVRESFRSGGPRVSGTWCYCSAGFEKFGFDVIFGEKLDIRVLESPLLGHGRCRFEMTLPSSMRSRY